MKEALKGKQSLKAPREESADYRVYLLSAAEKIRFYAVCVAAAVALALLFYHSIIPAIFIALALCMFSKFYAAHLKEKRDKKLLGQFRDGMSAFAAALRAGYSAENAIEQAYREAERIHGKSCYICREFLLIGRKLSVGETLEGAFGNLAARCDIEEIKYMAQVFAIAKRSGGSLTAIISDTLYMIDEKAGLNEEIKTMITAKRLEHRIMCIMPAAILLYVNISGADFIAPLYDGLQGAAIMSAALVFYGLAVFLGERIMKVSLLCS